MLNVFLKIFSWVFYKKAETIIASDVRVLLRFVSTWFAALAEGLPNKLRCAKIKLRPLLKAVCIICVMSNCEGFHN